MHHAEPATIEQVEAIHGRELYRSGEGHMRRGGGHLDIDTVLSKDSFDAALMAEGGAMLPWMR